MFESQRTLLRRSAVAVTRSAEPGPLIREGPLSVPRRTPVIAGGVKQSLSKTTTQLLSAVSWARSLDCDFSFLTHEAWQSTLSSTLQAAQTAPLMRYPSCASYPTLTFVRTSHLTHAYVPTRARDCDSQPQTLPFFGMPAIAT